jgi:hypothetical protein
LVNPLGLKERIDWERSGACPFGICFRTLDETPADAVLPFETWPYRPEYLPAGSSIPMVSPPRSLLEPLVFLMYRPKAPIPGASVLHRGSPRTLTGVIVHTPHPALSQPVQWFLNNGLFSVVPASDYLLELVLDHGTHGMTDRLAAPLPLAIRW